MPGNTPIKVPTRQPTSAKPRLIGVRATPKPSAMLEKKSPTSPLRPDTEREVEPVDEDHDRQERQHQGSEGDFERAEAFAGDRSDSDEQQRRHHDTEPLHGQGKYEHRQRHEDERTPFDEILNRPL